MGHVPVADSDNLTVTTSDNLSVYHLCDTQTCHVGSNFSLIGPQMGQIWDFLRSVSVPPFWLNVLKLILKSPRFVPFGANQTETGANVTCLCVT